MEALRLPANPSALSTSAEPRLPAAETGPSTSSSSPTASGGTTDTQPDDFFMRHRVRKTDTLAGLAVKYNVSIADIKRSNGLESDTAMYGRGMLLIPTRPLPIGPEIAAWASMLEAHYGAKGLASVSGRLRPAAMGALTELRGYYSTGASLAASPGGSDLDDEEACRCGFDFEALRQGTPGRRREPANREVELMTRPCSSSGYIEERLRRRRNGEEGEGGCDPLPALGTSGSSPGMGRVSPSSMRPPRFGSLDMGGTRREGGNVLAEGLQELRSWHRKGAQWREQMLNKLKRVASQPALIQAASGNLAVAIADVGQLGGRCASSASALGLQTSVSSGGGASAALRHKDGGKAD